MKGTGGASRHHEGRRCEKHDRWLRVTKAGENCSLEERQWNEGLAVGREQQGGTSGVTAEIHDSVSPRQRVRVAKQYHDAGAADATQTPESVVVSLEEAGHQCDRNLS